MASKQDIVTAIKNLDLFLKIPELKGAKPRLNPNGSPFAFAGGFNMVFQLLHNSKKWAFRVWHVPIGENKDRYLAISKYLTNSKLPYFADFIYEENGLLVNGELTDTIRMEWLDGILLKDYVEKHLRDRPRLEKLANDFLEMSRTLKENNISHGDLQEGNILIDDLGKIRLVDYDSVCIPELEGQPDLITGLKGYQHPSRFKNGKASLKADYFSELIIYLSILGIVSKPELWDKYHVKDTNYLLFNETDFENIEISPIYLDLNGVNPLMDSLLEILKIYLGTKNYLDIRYIEIQIFDKDCMSFFCTKNKESLSVQIVFETFIKRIWLQIETLAENAYVSCYDIIIKKSENEQRFFAKLLGFSPIEFRVEFRKIEIVNGGKEKSRQETDAMLLDIFDELYQDLLMKVY